LKNLRDHSKKKHERPHQSTLNTRRERLNASVTEFARTEKWTKDENTKSLADKVVEADLTPCLYDFKTGATVRSGYELRQHAGLTATAQTAVRGLIEAAIAKGAYKHTVTWSPHACDQCPSPEKSPRKARKRKYPEILVEPKPDDQEPPKPK